MPRDDRDLRDGLRKAADGDVPRFDAVWAAARARRASGKGPGGAWRYLIAPSLALGAAAAVWLVIAAVPGRGPARGAIGSATVADAGLAASDLYATRETGRPSPFTDTLLDEMAADLGTSKTVDKAGTVSGAAPTDVFLNMEIPAWDEAGERGVL
jgi:hypothetical protein